jgi:uncharacterized membrane protein SirB2
MLPYAFYKIVHLLGVALSVTALGGLTVHALNGGAKSENQARRLLIGMHGVGALFVLVGGFGLLARINFEHGAAFPGWLWVKLGVWACIAGLVALPYRAPAITRPLLLVIPGLVMTATMMAVYKPF